MNSSYVLALGFYVLAGAVVGKTGPFDPVLFAIFSFVGTALAMFGDWRSKP